MAKIKLFKRTRRNLPLLKRDLLGFTGHELVQVNILANKLDFLKQKYRELSASPRTSRLPSLQSTLVRIRYYIGQIRAAYRDIAAVEVDEKLLKDLLNGQGGRHVPRMTLDSMEQKLRIERRSFSSRFRFRDPVQLRRLLEGFQFPEGKISIKGSQFTSEEALMITLARLAYPVRWEDIIPDFGGRSRQELTNAFYWCINYIVINWAYLITSNTDAVAAAAAARGALEADILSLKLLSYSCLSIKRT